MGNWRPVLVFCHSLSLCFDEYCGYTCKTFYLMCTQGKDSCGPPGVDTKIEESSDIPILEDTSSSPTDCPQLCWLVATDIENIEK